MNSAQMFSEQELAQLWNQQADAWNQWDSLDSSEQLAWAQAKALQLTNPAPPADEGLAKLVDKLGWIAAQLGALSWTDDDATVVQSALLLQRQQARIIELEKQLEGVKPPPASERLRRCPTHGQQPANSWGCPECVRELREQLAAQAWQPVPVGERLPGPKDCIHRDDDDWCWGQERSVLTGDAAFHWRLMRVSALVNEAVNWLPAHYLPIPQEES